MSFFTFEVKIVSGSWKTILVVRDRSPLSTLLYFESSGIVIVSEIQLLHRWRCELSQGKHINSSQSKLNKQRGGARGGCWRPGGKHPRQTSRRRKSNSCDMPIDDSANSFGKSQGDVSNHSHCSLPLHRLPMFIIIKKR